MRSKRILSMTAVTAAPLPPVGSVTSIGRSANPLRAAMRRHSASRSTSSVCRSVAPASMRDSSSRSMTMASKRRTWPTTTSSACWVRSGSSPRRPSMTSAAAARAVIGERSSWLTSEAKRGLALDAGLDGVGHLVERVGEAVEVGIALAGDAGVEVAGGDLAGGVGDAVERAQQAPARPPADAGGQQDGDRRADDEGEEDRAQRAARCGRAGTPRSSWRRRRRCARRRRRSCSSPRSKRCTPDTPDVERLAQLGREALEGELRVGSLAGWSSLEGDGGEPVRTRCARSAEPGRRSSVVPERSCSRTRTALQHGLLAGDLGALLEQRGAGEGVRHDGQRHAGDQRDDPEEEGDLGAQAHRTTYGTRAPVWQGFTAAGEAPGGGRHLTGAA